MGLSRAVDAPPSLLSTGLILSTGLVLLLLSLSLRRFQLGPGLLLGRLALAVTVAWYVVFGFGFLYPHDHHRIWLTAVSYRTNYLIDAGLGALWLIGSYGLWRAQAPRPMKLFLGLLALSLPAMAAEPPRTAGPVQERLARFVARYAPRYEKVPPMQEDRGPEGLRRNAGDAKHRLVVLRKKASQAYGKLDVHHRLVIEAYTFARKEDREEALKKWFQCFDTLCDPLILHDGQGSAKMPPMLAVVHDKEVVLLRTSCETLGPEWTRNMKDFEESFGPGDPRIEVVGCTATAVVTPATSK